MQWQTPGGEYQTDFELAVQRAQQLGIDHIVIASCTGATARELHSIANTMKIVCVTHHQGFKDPGTNEMDDQTRQDLEKAGITVLTTTHLLAGVDRGYATNSGEYIRPK